MSTNQIQNEIPKFNEDKKGARIMLTDRWLSAIGRATQTAFWAIGYLIGFTLTTVLTFGLILPGSFPDIGKSRKYSWHIIDVRDGKAYLMAEVVSLIGWLFLSMLSWLVLLMCTH